MTEDQPPASPAQKTTDEELLEAIERVTAMLDAPAVPTAQIAAELPIKRQTAKRRLDDLADEGRVASLSTGQGHIWWLPDGEGGYVDPAALDHPIEAIDPNDVPPEVARDIAEKRLPELQPPETIWERLHEWGTGRADDVVGLFGVSVLFFVLPEPGVLATEPASPWIGLGVLDLGAFALATLAMLLAVAAGGARALGAIGGWALERGESTGEAR